MGEKQRETDGELDIRHPLIRQVAEMTAEATGVRLLIVYPEASGWGPAHGEAQPRPQPAFCRLIKGAPEGAKRCRACHILMAVAACHGGPAEQRCHAAASVLVSPATEASAESIAILSSCTFASEEAWDEARQRGEELGVDIASLREAFLELPHLSEQQLRLVRAAMQTMRHAIEVVRQNQALGARLRKLHSGRDPRSDLEQFLGAPSRAKTARVRAPGAVGEKSLLVRTVCELVRQRPDLPLTVKEIAGAGRLTPNHFSTIFREQAGCPFTEYLTKHRIAHAQMLLGNPALSINEIARLVGYDDPGYFARRFRQRIRLSPRQWRNRHARGRTPD